MLLSDTTSNYMGGVLETLDKNGNVPLHVQVSDFVREKIYSREWGVEERIPSEHELMAMLGLSRGTVQKGIRALVDEGLLVQQRGRGTYVTQPVMARPSSNRLLSYAESMHAQGIDFVTRVVELRRETAGKACAQFLQLNQGEKCLYLSRVRSVDNKPVMFIESHLNIRVAPGLEMVDFSQEGLFAAVERLSGRGVGSSEVTYRARTAGRMRAKYLECDEHTPILECAQLVRLDDGTPVEWGSVWLPANRCVISSETRREV